MFKNKTLSDYVSTIQHGKHKGYHLYNELACGADEILVIEMYFAFLKSLEIYNCYHIITQPIHNIYLNESELAFLKTPVTMFQSDEDYELNFESKYTPAILKLKQIYHNDSMLLFDLAYKDWNLFNTEAIEFLYLYPDEINNLFYFDILVITHKTFDINILKNLIFQTIKIKSINIINDQNINLNFFEKMFHSNNFKFAHNFIKEKTKIESFKFENIYHESDRYKKLTEEKDILHKLSKIKYNEYVDFYEEYKKNQTDFNYLNMEKAWNIYKNFHITYFKKLMKNWDDENLYFYEIKQNKFYVKHTLNVLCPVFFLNYFNAINEITVFTNFYQLANAVALSPDGQLETDHLMGMGISDIIDNNEHNLSMYTQNIYALKKNRHSIENEIWLKKNLIMNISHKHH